MINLCIDLLIQYQHVYQVINCVGVNTDVHLLYTHQKTRMEKNEKIA